MQGGNGTEPTGSGVFCFTHGRMTHHNSNVRRTSSSALREMIILMRFALYVIPLRPPVIVLLLLAQHMHMSQGQQMLRLDIYL
jgi:hypothetical protein